MILRSGLPVRDADEEEELVNKEINLDAARAARRETLGETPTVVFGGETFELEPELPFALVDALLDAGDEETAKVAVVKAMAKAMFGDRYADFMAKNPSMADVQELVIQITPLYGLTLGESSASES
jgi:hypothetical protein